MGDIKPSRRGLLHKEMGVPIGHKIPLSSLMKKKSKDKAEGNTAGLKRDVYAINVRK